MDLSRFNEAQKSAILHFNGPALVLAGPGSGKTTVLTRRIVYLVEEKHVAPEKILVVTFTKAAADEMKNRFLSQVSGGQGVRFGTFHAIFFSILRTYYKDLKIISGDQSINNLKTAIKALGQNPMNYEDYERELSFIKNRGQIPDDYKPVSEGINRENVLKLIELLRDMGIKSGKINFDDMAYETYRLFQDNPSILKQWQKKYSYFLLDEFQDICPIQYSLIQAMCELENNLFVVGDDDQSIYGFRGAGTEIMLGFPKDYPQAVCINLNKNYRCSGEIISSACKVIKCNKKRFDKVQVPVREGGSPVKFNSFINEKQQMDWLVDKLLSYKENAILNDVAILFRKHGDYDKLITRLKSYGIPFRLNDSKKDIMDTFIFSDIWQYLIFLEGCDNRNIFFNIMNKPFRGINRQACPIDSVTESSLSQFYMYDKCILDNIHKLYLGRRFTEKLSLFGKINYIRKGLGYDNYLIKEAAHNPREESQFTTVIEEIQKTSFNFENKEQWFRYITSREKEQSGKIKQEGVNLLTYHASKGLEFKTVFLPGVNEGNVPYNKATSQDAIEEERRMFYVAMTRAKDELYISYFMGTSEQPEKPSRFLKPLGVLE